MFKLIIPACLIIIMTFSQSAKATESLSYGATKSHNCTPTDVTVFFDSRLHVKCSIPMFLGGYGETRIYYFSVSTNDYDNLEHTRELASKAIASGKMLKLYARTSANYNPSGCVSSNCRKLIGISLLK